ncbi:alpha/beta fold hydrolase [Amycolatopsis jejuensis]|uniref:alpha/beta fold hydrolase n=1 Tax=Amycolatopsis jejuensis TaxID=330084 RepID=UPI00068E0D4C|nr:alpha/beta hydrolase [Amycolatopsis jejuensis]
MGARASRYWTPGPHGLLSYLRWPGPGEPILFLHPVNTAARVWTGIAERVDRASVAVDFRGHGRSEPGSSYLPQDYARDALAVLDYLEIDRVHVVGGSLGGAIAVELTALAPRRVASIALFGASLCIGFPAAQTAVMVESLRDLGVDGFFAKHGGEILGPDAAPEAAEELVRLASGRKVGCVAAIIADAFEVADSRPTARALTAIPPALVAVGSHDPTCPLSMARELGAALGVEPVVMEGIGHLPMIEDPGASAALVEAFFARVETPYPPATSRDRS